VLVSFRRQDLLDNAHPLYAGDMGLQNPASQMAVLHDADLLLVLGARLSDITTQGYIFPDPAPRSMRLVHVHADHAVIGTHFAADLAIAAPPTARLIAERRRIATPRIPTVNDGVPFEAVVETVARHLPGDAILTLDAGSFAASAYRIIPFAPPQRLLAPISGAMGFGIPAAVAAGLREPGRTIVCMVGDGGFLMTGGELAVALERRLPLKVIVSVNGVYGSIRIHQERLYPGRPSGTSFTNPDFALIGRAFGFPVTHIRTLADLAKLPELLRSPDGEFIVVETSVGAVLPQLARGD